MYSQGFVISNQNDVPHILEYVYKCFSTIGEISFDNFNERCTFTRVLGVDRPKPGTKDIREFLVPKTGVIVFEINLPADSFISIYGRELETSLDYISQEDIEREYMTLGGG
jgi:hypothetical protein